MVNLPPPNNDLNVPEGDQALAAPDGFAPKWIGEHDPHNNNRWIEWDVPLGGEDDDDWDDDVEWLMAPVIPRGLLKMEEVSDAEVADSIAIREIHPRVATVEEQVESRVDTYPSGQMAVPGQDVIVRLSQQVQTPQTALHGTESQNQQLRTKVAEIESHEGILMSYMLWMEERLTVLEK
uniref:Uncharacterized protein n=1 Tax=Tanacetum cinerariifolium TaxID=118510 RepID=A0A6L2MWZ0_TANCI|nr:hypothetical protein [Tanacetum cinerariifolium]